jgi:hypothetical protein
MTATRFRSHRGALTVAVLQFHLASSVGCASRSSESQVVQSLSATVDSGIGADVTELASDDASLPTSTLTECSDLRPDQALQDFPEAVAAGYLLALVSADANPLSFRTTHEPGGSLLTGEDVQLTIESAAGFSAPSRDRTVVARRYVTMHEPIAEPPAHLTPAHASVRRGHRYLVILGSDPFRLDGYTLLASALVDGGTGVAATRALGATSDVEPPAAIERWALAVSELTRPIDIRAAIARRRGGAR